MEIKDRDILVLGGWGMVGTALCRKLLERSPRSITISSLTRAQAESAVDDLKPYAGEVKLAAAWGNIFVRSEFKDLTRDELLGDPARRQTLARDVLEPTSGTEFNKFFLYQLISEKRPHIVIDCVNSATGLAYQDVYSGSLKVIKELDASRDGKTSANLIAEVEKLLCSLYLPQLVRHVQVIYQAMKETGTRSYVKVGTSGTGGMGLNIPYTHSEEKPSRVLLSKSCVAGAHSLLLFLMGRTPDAPYTKEIKPATAIAWKKIGYGEIKRGGAPIPLYDCRPDDAVKLEGTLDTKPHREFKALGENLEGVFIDTGENGTFSPGEFTAITTHDQMEFITPEEIAQTIVWEIEGAATGHDVVGALDASIMGPTYRAGFMRSLAIDKMRQIAEEHGVIPTAFELLGPPRVSKLLYEAHILKRVAGSIDGVLKQTPEKLSKAADALISGDAALRSRIISIGIPILLSDGKRLVRGPMIKVPGDPRKTEFEVTPSNLESWASSGWVDLRIENMKAWKARLEEIKKQAAQVDSGDTSSRFLRDDAFWKYEQPLDEGELVGWIFIHEDLGRRMK